MCARAASTGCWWPRALCLLDGCAPAARDEALPQPSDAPGDFHVDHLTANGFFHTLQARSTGEDENAAEARVRAAYACAVRSAWAAYGSEPGVLDERWCAAVAAGWPDCPADPIVDLYYTHNHTMLYEREIISSSWAQVVHNAAVADFLSALVASRGWDLPPHHWDFITITVCSLLTSLRLSKQYWGDTKVAMLCVATLRLWSRVGTFVAGIPAECERREPTPHVVQLPAEWADVFAPEATQSLFDFLLHVLESSESVQLTSMRAAVVRALGSAAAQLEWARLPAAARGGHLAAPALADACATVLAGDHHHHTKYLAHTTLHLLAEPLVLIDAEQLAAWTERQAEAECPPPEWVLAQFGPPLVGLEERADAALAHVPAGVESCRLPAQSKEEAAALGYLLLAEFLLHCARRPRDDLAAHYTQLFWVRQYLWRLISVSLRLLPGGVAAFASGRAPPPAPPDAAALFLRPPSLTYTEGDAGEVLGALSCHCVLACVRGAAGAARAARGAGGPEARALDRLLLAYVSPRLVRDQLELLHRHQDQLPDTKVTIYWSTGEVECSVLVDERRLPVCVSFARDHPLAPPRVSPAPPPAPPTHWIALYLTYQNGTLLNALKLWLASTSRRVERAPQCYICYCRLHPSSGHLPRVHCHQCRNKFHNECLSKWFTTSAKFNCPLCRATF